MTPTERLGAAFIEGIPEETWQDTYPFIHVTSAFIERILAADPDLAGDIELGAALRRVVAALPEGVSPDVCIGRDDGGRQRGDWWTATAFRGSASIGQGSATTPAAALDALADALEARQP